MLSICCMTEIKCLLMYINFKDVLKRIHLVPKSLDVPYKMFFNNLQIMISKTLMRNNVFQS